MTGTGAASRARPSVVSRRDVERELKQLRAHAGLTDARVKAAAPLLRHLATLETQRRGQDISAVGFVIWGLQTLDERGATDPVKLGALRFAYGIDTPKLHPNQLRKRREAYGEELVQQTFARLRRDLDQAAIEQRGHELEQEARRGWRSPDTLNTWEDEVIPELAEVLIAAAQGTDPSIKRIRDALPRRPTRVSVNDTTYLFSETGTVKEVYVIREVEALHDGVDEVEVSYSYYDDSRPEVLSFEPYTNCRLTKPVRFTPSKYSHARFDIPRLRRGDRLRFSYRVWVRTGVRCRPVVKTTPRTEQDQNVARVQFHPAYLPRRLWICRDITDPEIPWDGPPMRRAVLQVSDLGYAEASFTKLVRGLTYGLVWEWP
jgi:lambda repressor-like predicted transcriptional regulator